MRPGSDVFVSAGATLDSIDDELAGEAAADHRIARLLDGVGLVAG